MGPRSRCSPRQRSRDASRSAARSMSNSVEADCRSIAVRRNSAACVLKCSDKRIAESRVLWSTHGPLHGGEADEPGRSSLMADPNQASLPSTGITPGWVSDGRKSNLPNSQGLRTVGPLWLATTAVGRCRPPDRVRFMYGVSCAGHRCRINTSCAVHNAPEESHEVPWS
jgi:hypothetical protein